MTDRELLEAAAKAAGIEIDKSEFNGGGRGNDGFDITGSAVLDWHDYKTWNPLTDDGDALRLAVKLGIVIDFWLTPHLGVAGTVNFGKYKDAIFIGEQDIQESTRRAIVRAAAEIGREK